MPTLCAYFKLCTKIQSNTLSESEAKRMSLFGHEYPYRKSQKSTDKLLKLLVVYVDIK